MKLNYSQQQWGLSEICVQVRPSGTILVIRIQTRKIENAVSTQLPRPSDPPRIHIKCQNQIEMNIWSNALIWTGRFGLIILLVTAGPKVDVKISSCNKNEIPNNINGGATSPYSCSCVTSQSATVIW